MKIQESGENYLETILILKSRKGFVRSVDIANELSYSKASVSRAMSILKEAGFLEIEQSGNIVLTDTGMEKAGEIYERHRMIAEFLVLTLNIDNAHANADACRIEHIISQETFDRIKVYVNNKKDEHFPF